MKSLFLFFFIYVSVYYGACNNQKLIKTIPFSGTPDSFRPLYHFSPDSNWVNDPNGLIFLNGNYHLFYQYNPFSNRWGHMSWGHSVSTDLISWKKLPVALPEFTSPDSTATMIFSGSAVADINNTSGFAEKKGQVPLVAIYTSNVVKKNIQLAQHQSIAYSLDEGISWKQFTGNPVLDIGSKDFRDPKVFWYEPKKKWIMLVSKAVEHTIQFYESTNLKTWKFLSVFGNLGNTATVWECPDIFLLPVENSIEKKWVLSLSAGHPQKNYLAMQYFVGDFNGEKFTPETLHYPLYLDYGKDFYAGVTFNNIAPSDGRTIMIGWASSWIYANDIPTGDTWRGIYAIPRELHLRKADNQYELIQLPVKEYDNQRKETFSLDKQAVDSLLDIPFHGDSYELDLTIEPNVSKQCGVKILKTGEEETTITIDNESGQLLLDRTKSGYTTFNKQFSSMESAPLKQYDKTIRLKIIVDKSLVEVFANDGETAVTDLVFPRMHNGGIQLFTKNGKAVFTSIKLYQIKGLK